MTSAQVNIDKEMMDMVARFRVIELQELLGHAGKNKSGRKCDLVERAMQLIRSSGYNNAIQTKIVELYGRRYPHQASILNSKFSSILNQNNMNGRSPEIPDAHLSMSLLRYPVAVSTIKFKSLPFYENLSTILSPVAMNSNSSRCFFEHSFVIDGNQADDIRYQTPDLPDKQTIQVQMRFCVFDSSSEQEDRLPSNLHVQVNGHFVPLPPVVQPTKSGVKPKQLHLPLNITSICERIGLHKQFRLSVRWLNDEPQKTYAVGINLVRLLSIDDLLQKLNSLGPLPSSESRRLVREKLSSDPDSDIATTSLKVSLLCPLGKMRMKLPTRPNHCRHLQCFDAALFLMMNEKKPTWICPVCDKSADFHTLRLDGLFLEILEDSNSDEIEFTDDGSWHCSKWKEEIASLPNNPIDLSQSGQAYVELESSKSKAMDVIDLTADSSDDETVINAKSPPRVASDTPVSISSSPLDVSTSAMTNGRINSPFSSMQKSPQKFPASYTSPSRSPFCQRDSPRILSRSSYTHPYAAKPAEPSRRTPVKQTSITPGYSPFNPNGPLDSTSNVPSPYTTASPAPHGGIFSPYPNLDISTNNYPAPFDSDFLLRVAQRSPFDTLNPSYFMNSFPGAHPYFPFPMMPFPNFHSLQPPTSIPDSRTNDCGLSTPQPGYNADLSLTADSIPID